MATNIFDLFRKLKESRIDGVVLVAAAITAAIWVALALLWYDWRPDFYETTGLFIIAFVIVFLLHRVTRWLHSIVSKRR